MCNTWCKPVCGVRWGSPPFVLFLCLPRANLFRWITRQALCSQTKMLYVKSWEAMWWQNVCKADHWDSHPEFESGFKYTLLSLMGLLIIAFSHLRRQWCAGQAWCCCWRGWWGCGRSPPGGPAPPPAAPPRPTAGTARTAGLQHHVKQLLNICRDTNMSDLPGRKLFNFLHYLQPTKMCTLPF